MTTFKNNAKYAELLLSYLDVAHMENNPLTIEEVMSTFHWRFKGGSLAEASSSTRLKPETSGERYPSGDSHTMLYAKGSEGNLRALKAILLRRKAARKLTFKGVLGRLGTYSMLTSHYGLPLDNVRVYSGMRAIYHMYGRIWDWAQNHTTSAELDQVLAYTREMAAAGAAVSNVHVPTVEENRREYQMLLERTPVAGLLESVRQIKDLIRLANSKMARQLAYNSGRRQRDAWENAGYCPYIEMADRYVLVDEQAGTRALVAHVGPMMLRVSQKVVMANVGPVRYALSESDLERLHQVVMSTLSALVGVAAQASSGTPMQKSYARRTMDVAVANLQRIVDSSRKVALGEEVLVCKGYRRAYTAHLGHLAGGLCRVEALGLIEEAKGTAPEGVLDIDGFLSDARSLDAAGSLNACKMFKVCPAPDVSPGLAMIDRVLQIGNCNVVSETMMAEFEVELRDQILRAYIRHHKGKLALRAGVDRPMWYASYMMGDMDKVPSTDIHEFLAWEGTATMPDISPHDPANWKDSGLGADTVMEAKMPGGKRYRRNMITRLLFDEECPMPGRSLFAEEHVIKFFVKAEGHKDPARGIFSANLTDRQAQSWMERAVDKVAREHPSYMIGQPVEVKEARVIQLTATPKSPDLVALFYSFDISGWSAKMPAEPQRISHSIWAQMYNSDLFRRATQVNEGAYIYVDIEGYFGSYINTASNLEGFNGKEMTMVLVAMLSLSVRRWRAKVVETGLMDRATADGVSALLFAYIDDGLSRIDLPRMVAEEAFTVYKETVIETFAGCGFSVEVTKCFPSDVFSIFLNEVYLAGRHVVHGVRAAMAISSEPTERHNSLIERVSSVATGCRGAVMAGLAAQSATFLMSFHTYMHILEWVSERDPVVLAAWSYCPRAWGGLGMPQMMQLFTSGSGSAFEEGVATLQRYARMNHAVRKIFLSLARAPLKIRDATGVLTAPLSGKPIEGYMVDSRVSTAVRESLAEMRNDGKISTYAKRLLDYSDGDSFALFATAVVPLGQFEVLHEQMLDNIAESHPHAVFSAFARRLEKSTTLLQVVGRDAFTNILRQNRSEAEASVLCMVCRLKY